MSEEIKEKKGNKLTYVVIGLLLVGMAGFGTQQFGLGSGLANNAVISAGDIEISSSLYLNNLNQVKQSNPEMTDEQATQLTVNGLSKQVALGHYIEKYPLGASKKELANTIKNNIAFFENGKYSSEAFKANVSNAEAYLNNISASRSVDALQKTIASTAIISETERYPYDKLSALETDVIISKLKRSDFSADITDEAVKSYYEKNKANLLTDEKFAIQYIHLNPKDIVEKITLSDKELASVSKPIYQANYYLIKDSQTADTILSQVNDEKTISDILNMSPEQFEDHGDLGEVESQVNDESLISQEAVDAIYALNKEGELTPVVMIDDSAYLFELTKKVSVDLSEAQKTQKINRLKEEKAKPKINDLNSQLNTLVFEENQTDLIEIAEKVGLIVQLTTLESIDTPSSNILKLPAVAEALKANEKTLDKLQEPITTEDDQVILYQLSEYKAPREKTLDETQVVIKNQLSEKSIKDQMNSKADEIIEMSKKEGLTAVLEAQSIPSQLFTNFNTEVKEGKFKGNDLIDVISAFLITQQPPNLGNEQVAKIEGANGDVFLYSTVAVDFKESAKDENKADKNKTLEGEAQRLGFSELNYFIQSVTDNTDIKVSNRLNELAEPSQ